MLLKDKYCPKTLQEYKIHSNISINIKALLKDGDIPNTIIYGPHGSGKYTLALCMVAQVFGLDIYKKKYQEVTIKVSNNNTKTINVVQSMYHFEIFVNKYLYNDKSSLIKYLSEISKNKNINTNIYNVVIIRNFDLLSKDALEFTSALSLAKSSKSCPLTASHLLVTSITPSFKN